MPNSKNKGNAFERSVCKMLSLWWSCGERDDIFWRTSNSGGRATTNKATKLHCGDICSIDPVGDPFTRFMTLELKKGYNGHTIHALLDRPEKAAKQGWESFIEQAERSAGQAGTPYWGVIHQRDRREVLIAVPAEMFRSLDVSWEPLVVLHRKADQWQTAVALTTLEEFLSVVTPADVENLARVERVVKGKGQ